MTTPANTIRALNPTWIAIQAAVDRAERNLHELEPCTTHVGGDQALTAQATIRHAVTLINREITRLGHVVYQFDYTVTGEHGDYRESFESWVNKHAVDGCVSCGREEVRVFTVCDDKQRAGLCTWCGKFQTSTGFLPTPTLLTTHWAGKRITNALVDRELKPLREAEAKRRATKRTTRKKGKTAA